MKLIDADVKVTEFTDYGKVEMTIKDYLDGCPKAVEAIPVVWIEEYIKKLQESFVSLTGWPAIEEMVKKWREEQKC